MVGILTSIALGGAAALFAAWLALAGAPQARAALKMIAAVPRWRLAAFLFFAAIATLSAQKGGDTNAPPQRAMPPRTVQRGEDVPRSGESAAESVANLRFAAISVSSNEVALSLVWPANLLANGDCLDLFAKAFSLTNRWRWIGCHEIVSADTNLEVSVDFEQFAGTTNAPPAAFFSVSDRATSADTMRDSDGDGIPDVYELANGTNPYVLDAALAPKLTVGDCGDYADIEDALEASEEYSIIELSAGEHELSDSLVLPDRPIMLTGPEDGYAVLRSKADIAVVMLDGGQDSETLFRNIILVLERRGGYQAGFWVGGNLPWSGLGASPTFDNVRVRAPYPDTLYYGWHYYRDDGGTSVVSRCTMNAAGAESVIGVYSYGGPAVEVADCHFVNFPATNGNYATYFRSGANIVAEYAAPESGLSWAGYPLDGEYSATADSDGDGLSDYDEIFTCDTDPWLADSDGDGVSDGDETAEGTDPRNLSSYLLHVCAVVVAADGLADTTNYVAWGVSAEGWGSNTVAASAANPSTNEFAIATPDGEVYVKAFRDFDRDGVYSPDTDIMLCHRLSAGNTVATEVFRFGDVDGDGVADMHELSEGTDPYDAGNYCFNLSLAEIGLTRTTNGLTVAVMFDDEVVYGPIVATSRVWEADIGHFAVTNGERASVWIWDDTDGNGVCDADESCTMHEIEVSGHDNVVTNAFPSYVLDQDRDGIPDWWEIVHADAGLSSTNAADAYLDPDSDGLINLHEFWIDCNPLAYDGTNTVLSVMARSVDERICGRHAELSKSKFINYKSNAANDVFVANTNFWLHGVDTTCASPWQSNGNRHQWAATLITPRHIICARHFASGVGTTYWFIGKSGTVYKRRTVSRADISTPANTDISILMLNSDLPGDDVSPAKLLPANYPAYIGNGAGLPRICFNQEEEAVLQDVKSVSLDSLRHVTFINGTYPVNEARAEFYRDAISGDSGSPCFLLLGDQLVLTNTTWTGPGFGGTMLSDYIDEVERALNFLSPGGGYCLQFVDLENYSVMCGEMQ